MKWSGFCWLALIATAAVLEVKTIKAAPNPQPEDMWKTLLELDRMYSAIARPRFGKRSGTADNGHFELNDYGNQYQSGRYPTDYFAVRR